MKLNIDCIRDTLITIEEKHQFTAEKGSHNLPSNTLSEYPQLLKNYSPDDIVYSIKQLWLSGFIEFCEIKALNAGFQGWIQGITPAGHEFLESIRNDTTWNTVKDISKNIGSQSLSAVSDIAVNVVSSLISARFQ